jgi:hypothetical protein
VGESVSGGVTTSVSCTPSGSGLIFTTNFRSYVTWALKLADTLFCLAESLRDFSRAMILGIAVMLPMT